VYLHSSLWRLSCHPILPETAPVRSSEQAWVALWVTAVSDLT
jgi:hypothetical protein